MTLSAPPGASAPLKCFLRAANHGRVAQPIHPEPLLPNWFAGRGVSAEGGLLSRATGKNAATVQEWDFRKGRSSMSNFT
jgi:hypothetical protein